MARVARGLRKLGCSYWGNHRQLSDANEFQRTLGTAKKFVCVPHVLALGEATHAEICGRLPPVPS